jgi:hypothetical protein
MEDPTVKRGADVARCLGWPSGRRGVFGALGDLFEPDLVRFHLPRSYQRVLERQHQAQVQQLRKALSISASNAIGETTRRSKVG